MLCRNKIAWKYKTFHQNTLYFYHYTILYLNDSESFFPSRNVRTQNGANFPHLKPQRSPSLFLLTLICSCLPLYFLLFSLSLLPLTRLKVLEAPNGFFNFFHVEILTCQPSTSPYTTPAGLLAIWETVALTFHPSSGGCMISFCGHSLYLSTCSSVKSIPEDHGRSPDAVPSFWWPRPTQTRYVSAHSDS